MSALHRYLGRLHDLILARQEIRVEELEILDRSDRPGQSSEFYAQLRFSNGSQLQVVEKRNTAKLAFDLTCGGFMAYCA